MIAAPRPSPPGSQVPAAERFTAKVADTGIQPFLDAERGTLLAPNRYDGMDLAAESCRMMLMAGLPADSHLQDRFLEAKLRAGEVLHEWIRTRIVQGAGRCTRGPKDWAVVVIEGEDLLRFQSQAEVRSSLPVELQAKVAFGLQQSQTPPAELALLIQNASSRTTCGGKTPNLPSLSYVDSPSEPPPPPVGELSASTVQEVEAWTRAWQQDWESASRAAVDVLSS